jgi:hypothetical protein
MQRHLETVLRIGGAPFAAMAAAALALRRVEQIRIWNKRNLTIQM